jgi:hypothetical protein
MATIHRLLGAAFALFVISGCSLTLDVGSEEGRPCGAADECLDGFTCEGGVCVQGEGPGPGGAGGDGGQGGGGAGGGGAGGGAAAVARAAAARGGRRRQRRGRRRERARARLRRGVAARWATALRGHRPDGVPANGTTL